MDHDLADDLLCGWTAGLAAACEVFSPAQLQEQRRDAARKAREKAREAEKKARKAARRDRAARAKAEKKAGKAREQARKAAAAAAAASAQAVAGGRAKLPASSAFGRIPVPAGHPVLPAGVYGDPRHVPALRGLGADGKASRGARVKGQEAPQHLGFFWHRTRLNAAQRGVDRKTNETTVIGPVIDEMDLAGVCLTVDALHSLADLNKRVLARGGHVIFVIKGNQPRTYQALNDIGWEQIPAAAATFEADRGRVETRTMQVAPAPEGLKYPDMKQAGLIERYTTFKDKKGKTVTRSETVLILTTASPDQAPPADLLALNRGHWAATEATHWIRDTDLKEDSSQARATGAARFMATAGNTVLACSVYTVSPTSPPNAAFYAVPTARYSSEWASQQAKQPCRDPGAAIPRLSRRQCAPASRPVARTAPTRGPASARLRRSRSATGCSSATHPSASACRIHARDATGAKCGVRPGCGTPGAARAGRGRGAAWQRGTPVPCSSEGTRSRRVSRNARRGGPWVSKGCRCLAGTGRKRHFRGPGNQARRRHS